MSLLMWISCSIESLTSKERLGVTLKSTLEEVDITKYADMPSNVDKAYKTNSGNYVLEIHASGFSINGDHY